MPVCGNCFGGDCKPCSKCRLDHLSIIDECAVEPVFCNGLSTPVYRRTTLEKECLCPCIPQPITWQCYIGVITNRNGTSLSVHVRTVGYYRSRSENRRLRNAMIAVEAELEPCLRTITESIHYYSINQAKILTDVLGISSPELFHNRRAGGDYALWKCINRVIITRDKHVLIKQIIIPHIKDQQLKEKVGYQTAKEIMLKAVSLVNDYGKGPTNSDILADAKCRSDVLSGVIRDCLCTLGNEYIARMYM